MQKIPGNNFSSIAGTGSRSGMDNDNATLGQLGRSSSPSSQPQTPGLSELQGTRPSEGHHASARFSSDNGSLAHSHPAPAQGLSNGESAGQEVPQGVLFPLVGWKGALSLVLEGHTVAVDASGWVTAGGLPVLTHKGKRLQVVDGVPMADGQIVTVSRDGRVFVGGQRNAEEGRGYYGGKQTTLTTDLPALTAKLQAAAAARDAKLSSESKTPRVKSLFDVLVRNERGEPFFKLRSHTIKANPEQNLLATLQQGRLRMSDGTSLVAYRNLTDLRAYDSNCHGYSIGDHVFTIDNNDMQEWLDKTSLLTKTEDPRLGDLVVYRNIHGNIEHSAILTGPGMVTMAGGTHMYHNDVSTTPPGGTVGPSKLTWVPVEQGWTLTETTIEYWRPAASTDSDER